MAGENSWTKGLFGEYDSRSTPSPSLSKEKKKIKKYNSNKA